MEWVREWDSGLQEYMLLFTVQLVSEAMKYDDRVFRIESD